MNILRLTPHFYHPPEITEGKWDVRLDPIGGMQTQIYRLAIALSDKGVSQTVLTIGVKKGLKKWVLNKNINVVKSNTIMLPIKSRVRGTVGLNIYWGIGTVMKIIWYKFLGYNSKHNVFDIIHSHCSGVAAPIIVGYMAKLLLGKPLIYTVHCSRVSTYEPMNRLDRIINKYIIKIEEFCIKKCDGCILLTEKTKSAMLRHYLGIDTNKLNIIPDMISFKDFSACASSDDVKHIYEKYQLQDKKNIISFVGRIAHEKGWKYLVEAIDMFKQNTANDVHFIFCGDGNERYELQEMVDNFGLKQYVTITGFVATKDVAAVLKISQIIVVPSLHEELGSVILEAACMKKALIITSACGLKDLLIYNDAALIIPPKSPCDIYNKIIYLINNKEIRISLGKKLHQALAIGFDKEMICDLTIEQYNKLAQMSSAKS